MRRTAFALIYLFSSAYLYAEDLLTPGFVCRGEVTYVFDGDTVSFTCNRFTEKHKIRLAEIDTPEIEKNFKPCYGQAYGEEAKVRLQKLTLQQPLLLEVTDNDHYGRSVGRLYSDHANINLLMVQQGFAYHYSYYSQDERYKKAQEDAEKQNIGLWANSESCRTAPWDWRRLEDEKRCTFQKEYTRKQCLGFKLNGK